MKKLIILLSIFMLAIVLSLGSGIVQASALAGTSSTVIPAGQEETLASSMRDSFSAQGLWRDLWATIGGFNQDVIDCGPACSIDIRKQAEGEDSRDFVSGSDVTFEIVVTNTGSYDLTDVVVTDEQAPGCATLIGDLAAGESVSYTCTVPAVIQGFTNTACVEGVIQNLILSDCDSSTVRVADIDIRKQAEGPDSRDFVSGSDVTFEIVVTNTGEIDLTDVEVTDAEAPGCANFIGDLAAGASVTYSCTVPAVTEGFTNTACVAGLFAAGQVDDCDSSEIRVADIFVRKQAKGPDSRTFGVQLNVPHEVSFEIEVINTGEVALTDVVVSDEQVPGCAQEIGNLAVGESITYTCTATFTFATDEEIDAGALRNIAVATGNFDGGTVDDDDPSSVNFIPSSIPGEIFKLFCPICSKAPVAREYTMGYEDWEDPFLDYDYNDWVTDVRTELFYVGEDQINKLIFYFYPQARGGVFKAAFHIDFAASFLTSSGTAAITLYDQNGDMVPTESYTQPIVAGSTNRFTVFDDTYIVFPPAGAVVNAIENTTFQRPQRTARLTITLDEPIVLPQDQLTYAFVGPHGSGLFFDPHLNIKDPRVDISGGEDYEIGKGDLRTLVIPTMNYKWPEEHVLITYAYPLVTGTPPGLVFPDNWWTNSNECVYGDGVVCPEASLRLSTSGRSPTGRQ